METPLRYTALLIPILLSVTPAPAAELYKWVDENGVTNYSNKAPPKGTAKAVTTVEDRLSVYTPEKTIIALMERMHEQRMKSVAESSSASAVAGAAGRGGVIAPVSPATYDPCAIPGDANCPAYLDQGAPVFAVNGRPARLVQPHLPRGAIAGTITDSSSFIPGLSGLTPSTIPPPHFVSRTRRLLQADLGRNAPDASSRYSAGVIKARAPLPGHAPSRRR